jgi:hypothetical protein
MWRETNCGAGDVSYRAFEISGPHCDPIVTSVHCLSVHHSLL